MRTLAFSWAALSDEIASDLEAALATMAGCGIRAAELRTVFGKNVLDLSDEDASRCAAVLRANGCTVSGLASPIGKSPLGQPAGFEDGRLRRACALAARLGTDRIRVFSFYPDGQPTAAGGEEVVRRIAGWAHVAEEAGITLVLENEVGLWGDVPERCLRILTAVGSPRLRLAWDPANFLRSGVGRPFTEGWPLLGPHVACVHVKDCRPDGTHTPAGEGAGQWPELVRALAERGGVPLVMEPHLEVAGHSVGFTGPERFREAVAAIRGLVARAHPS